MQNIIDKYANLLVNYCLEIKENERVYVASSYLAEELLLAVQKFTLQAGGNIEFDISLQGQQQNFYKYASGNQLEYLPVLKKEAMQEFDAYLNILAPFNLRETNRVDSGKRKQLSKARKEIGETYMKRTGAGTLKRSLCLYPTPASAQEAGMSLSEYQEFVFNACYLYEEDPIQKWLGVREKQQKIVDVLNQRKKVAYKGPNIDITFSTEGRKWINSDGRNNMPSGEVYTTPVEDSVNGQVKFTLPSIYQGTEVEEVELEIKEGEIIHWKAKKGKEFLDEIFSIEGATRFGEAAIGTNDNIQQITKNILFDEKIGGTIHMAVGQSYYQTGGKNQSSVHWDMITDMKDGGEIYADDELIYKNGSFLLN